MNMNEAIQVSCIIDKLPSSWKDFKHTLKHQKEELTLVELGSHLRIAESFRVRIITSQKVSKAVDEIVTDAVHWAIQAPLRDHFRDFPKADMKEILHQRMWETNSYKAHEDHKKLYEALEKSMDRDHTDHLLTDLAEARRKKKRRHDSPKTPPGSPPHQPPPPLPPACPSGTLGSSGASGTAAPSSSKIAASAEYTAWTTTDTRFKPSVSSIPEDLPINDDSALDEQVHSSDDEDIGSDQIPKTSALASTYAPLPENSLLAQTGDMAIFMDWYCKKQGITELKQKDLEGPAFEIVKVFHPNVIHLQYQMEECHKLLTDKVVDVIIRPAFSISKMKAAYYPDQMWIEEECKYDIAAMYGISHWWFQRQRFYIDKHTSEEMDFKYLYPSDFEDLYLLNLQGHLNHLPPNDKKILTTALNLTKPRWDATGFEYKHDFTIIESPRAVTFRDKYRVQMIIRFNEIHKFSDGTLQQIDEALDYRVKEFKVNRMNPSLNTRFWIRKDVNRSKEFMFAIQKRLKTRRIFRNLEYFIGGRVRE
ncbi:hypothetical protein Tco_0080418 [Tanacetum coccineum]